MEAIALLHAQLQDSTKRLISVQDSVNEHTVALEKLRVSIQNENCVAKNLLERISTLTTDKTSLMNKLASSSQRNSMLSLRLDSVRCQILPYCEEILRVSNEFVSRSNDHLRLYATYMDTISIDSTDRLVLATDSTLRKVAETKLKIAVANGLNNEHREIEAFRLRSEIAEGENTLKFLNSCIDGLMKKNEELRIQRHNSTRSATEAVSVSDSDQVNSNDDNEVYVLTKKTTVRHTISTVVDACCVDNNDGVDWQQSQSQCQSQAHESPWFRSQRKRSINLSTQDHFKTGLQWLNEAVALDHGDANPFYECP